MRSIENNKIHWELKNITKFVEANFLYDDDDTENLLIKNIQFCIEKYDFLNENIHSSHRIYGSLKNIEKYNLLLEEFLSFEKIINMFLKHLDWNKFKKINEDLEIIDTIKK